MIKTEKGPEGQKIKYFAHQITMPSDMRMQFVHTLAEHAHFTRIMHGDEKAGKYEETKHQLIQTA